MKILSPTKPKKAIGGLLMVGCPKKKVRERVKVKDIQKMMGRLEKIIVTEIDSRGKFYTYEEIEQLEKEIYFAAEFQGFVKVSWKGE